MKIMKRRMQHELQKQEGKLSDKGSIASPFIKINTKKYNSKYAGNCIVTAAIFGN